MNNEIQRGVMALYGCGGTGINIVSHYQALAGKEEPAVARIEPYYADTSKANVKAALDPNRLFLIEDVDGSGKRRIENAAEIKRSVIPILQTYRPGDLNVVVFSASGGTGSVFGPLIVAELLERGQQVVAVVVGTDECENSARNTLKTLQSLEGISQKTGKMVMMYYDHLKQTDKRSEIDDRVRYVITSLAILASRRNAEIDLKDLANFFNFATPVTSVAPQLSTLEVYRSHEEANAASAFAIAVASLLKDPDTPSLNFRPEYRCTGYPLEPMPGEGSVKSLHFVAAVDTVADLYKVLKKSTEEIASAKLTRKAREVIVKIDDLDDSGMTF